MNDDPSQIAAHLIEQHGVDGAWDMMRNGIMAAQADEDNYGLSVWREVRRELELKQISANSDT